MILLTTTPLYFDASFHFREGTTKHLQEKYLQEVDIRPLKQFCFLDADCLVVVESQGSSRRSVVKYPVKLVHPEGDSQTSGTY